MRTIKSPKRRSQTALLMFALLCAVACPAMHAGAAPDVGEIRVVYDGRPVVFDVPPIIESGRTLVPMRALLEALGAKVDWNEGTKTVTATTDDVTVELTIGSDRASVNGTVVPLDVPGRIVQNRTLVPLRFVSENLGLIVNWNGARREISVKRIPELRESITISLPFSEASIPRSLMPMGETINHPDPPNPGGHPGIDFMWDKSVDIIASVGGTVSKVEQTANHGGKWDVTVDTGGFYVGYTTLERVDERIRVGSSVAAGQKIGEPGYFGSHYMIHWELGRSDFHIRICPMAYFDETSRRRISDIWANTKWPEMKEQFPHICNYRYRCRFCRTNGY